MWLVVASIKASTRTGYTVFSPSCAAARANGEEREASDGQPTAPAAETEVFTPEDLAVLEALRSSLKTLTCEELESLTGLSARTLGKSLPSWNVASSSALAAQRRAVRSLKRAGLPSPTRNNVELVCR